ncbi:STE20-like serine/threonine-protein kinase isoform X2, partial [Biomphalaria glabrata]
DNTKKKTFIDDIENTTPEFVCELTGLSEIKCVDNCPHIIGQHEHQITKNGETDLQMCKALCTKNPGHVNFIEIDKFGIDDLPEGYRDIEIVEYIKAVAGLTVKISVSKTSPHRPKFWPDTQIPYPLYDVRGQSELRTGSGIISSIYRFRDTVVPFQKCPCHKCRLSDEPSKIWWKIYILTATNLVFDSVEARATRLTLFYDQENGSTITLD